jgi:sulfite exporter TauE/SafE
MDPSAAATPAAAFAAGLACSLHCAAMCGPLACAVRATGARYHLSRLASYTIVGAVAGGLGESVALIFDASPLRFLPWALAAVLLAIAFGLDRRIPQPRFAARWLLRARLDRSLGWLTPLIPCGPFWLMLGVAVLTGSWLRGALLTASFAVGTIPLYWLLQSQFNRFQAWLSPAALWRLQRGLAFIAGGLLIWRAAIPGHACCL